MSDKVGHSITIDVTDSDHAIRCAVQLIARRSFKNKSWTIKITITSILLTSSIEQRGAVALRRSRCKCTVARLKSYRNLDKTRYCVKRQNDTDEWSTYATRCRPRIDIDIAITIEIANAKRTTKQKIVQIKKQRQKQNEPFCCNITIIQRYKLQPQDSQNKNKTSKPIKW